MPTVTLISNSPEETQSLGESWGREAQAGWVFGLDGDLGAGKTQLARGIARGAGYMGRIQSPTFALLQEYLGGRLPVHHLDLYRLEDDDAIDSAGLLEYFQPEGIAIIEWASRWTGARPQHYRKVFLETVHPMERRIHIEDFGI